jgi:hypothetical protein
LEFIACNLLSVLSWAAVKARNDIRTQIRKFRGIFKRKPGEKLVTQELLEDRAEDLRLEEAKRRRFEKRMQRCRRLS